MAMSEADLEYIRDKMYCGKFTARQGFDLLSEEIDRLREGVRLAAAGVETLFPAIEHDTPEHRQWLKEKLDVHFEAFRRWAEAE